MRDPEPCRMKRTEEQTGWFIIIEPSLMSLKNNKNIKLQAVLDLLH